MSGYDGRVGAGSTSVSRSGPLRTVCNGASGTTIIFGDTPERLAGAVLDLTRGESDLRVVLVDEAGDAVMTLGAFPEEDAIAIWRSIVAAGKAASSRLTGLVFSSIENPLFIRVAKKQQTAQKEAG